MASRAYATLAIELQEVRQEVACADARLAKNPHDEEARKLCLHGRELLERLEIAEAVLIGLFEDGQHSVLMPPPKEKY